MQPQPGLYFDPNHDGHGFDLQPVGDRWVLVFFTYGNDGSPEWLLGVLEHDEQGVIRGNLDFYDYQSDRDPAQAVLRSAGPVVLDFADLCDDGLGVSFSWSLDDETGDWCVQPLFDQSVATTDDYTGLWYAGPADQGWGLSLDFSGSGQEQTEVQVLFYFDQAGSPRWALGTGQGAAETSISLNHFVGYCRTCVPIPLQVLPAGEISHALTVADGLPAGSGEIDITYPLTPGGRWLRDTTPLTLLTDPARGLIPLPELIQPSRKLAILNTNVVPMTDDGLVLEHQTVVVEDSVITAVGDYASIVIPDDAVRIDGRDLYVGPGLHDMHTHFTFGGPTPMREAGTLFIANGVTTVLNMGDGGTQNLPGTDQLFGSGDFIGPAVYAGQVAYGPGDGRPANLTVSTPAQATAYAESIQAAGYQFIKLYNSLSPSVVAQFELEGQRLDMPVIGHLPKNISMRQALESGQSMIAHVAEIYFTLLGNQPNEALLAEAALLMRDNNVYLTDTLTASESFAANFGGNEANFDIFSRREGVLYQPTSFAINGWRNFFNSTVLQPPGSQPGQLDGRLAFFKQMVKFFNDAGVPIILGTDSPGHIGVISGFSVHENLRLYDEIGMSPNDAYSAASRNPGNFFADTLNPDISWGTIEAGKRADILLLEANPLDSVLHLKRPLAVVTRGRLYSRDYLQQELDALDAKYPDPFGKSGIHAAPTGIHESFLCDHDI